MTWTIDGSLELQNLDIIGNGKRICMIDCDDDTVSDYDHMANARLIAAAPDLLAALKSMVINYAQFGRVTESNIRDAARLMQGIDQ